MANDVNKNLIVQLVRRVLISFEVVLQKLRGGIGQCTKTMVSTNNVGHALQIPNEPLFSDSETLKISKRTSTLLL